MQVQLDTSMVLVGPQRPGHPRHRREHRAIDRRESLQRLRLAPGVQGSGLDRQFLHDRPEQVGIEDPRGLGQEPSEVDSMPNF